MNRDDPAQDLGSAIRVQAQAMTTPDLDHLRQLALAATPGPWAFASGFEQSDPGNYVYSLPSGQVVTAGQDATDCTLSKADAEYLAAASPDVVLALLDGQASTDPRDEMAANLVDFLLELEAKADLDSDPISIEGMTDGGEIVGAVVFIRGADVFDAFKRWAAAAGYLTPGKGIVDGTETRAPEIDP